MNLKSYIGPKPFYKRVLTIGLPSALQQLLGSAMGIVDSIMVSWIGQVTAVGTAAQIEALLQTVGFGAATGTGMFAAQFYGAQDYRNLRRTFGLSLVLLCINGLFWTMLAMFFGQIVLAFYMKDPVVLASSNLYMRVVLYSYLPSMISFAFAYIYRSIQKTHVPMVIGIVSMACNVVVNYVLIFGKFGFPQMGVQGAAMGTIAAQSIAMIAHVTYAYKTKQPFVGTLKEMFSFDWEFVKPILQRSYPLIVNEILFGIGATMYIKAFGSLGKSAMDSYYVGNQIANVFFAVCMGISQATAAMIGATLGKNDIHEAKVQSKYFIGVALVMSLAISVVIFGLAEPMVLLFGLTDANIEAMSVLIVQITALRISLRMFNVIVFSSLRAGGDSKYITFLDAGLMWIVGIPLAYFLVHVAGFTSIAWVFLLVQFEQVVRVFFGMRRLRTGKWARNLTAEIE